MKKLQIALDMFSIEEALRVLDRAAEYVDIIEVGTPLMIAQGAEAVRRIKEKHPNKTVFADIKVMDAGSDVPTPVLEAGADMFSVLGAAEDATVLSCIALARQHSAKVLVDMCAVPDIHQRAAEIEPMGPDYIAVHVGYDLQKEGGHDPVEELRKLDGVNVPKAIAGGIRLETFEDAARSSADDIICGAGIWKQADIGGTAKQMREILDRVNKEMEAASE